MKKSCHLLSHRVFCRISDFIEQQEVPRIDKIQSHEGWFLEVEGAQVDEGLITYFGAKEDGEECVLPEGQLNNFIQL
ncbi:MAG: hypothetical protein P8Y30_04580, partial [candidate division WOR-3 bacterium]